MSPPFSAFADLDLRHHQSLFRELLLRSLLRGDHGQQAHRLDVLGLQQRDADAAAPHLPPARDCVGAQAWLTVVRRLASLARVVVVGELFDERQQLLCFADEVAGVAIHLRAPFFAAGARAGART